MCSRLFVLRCAWIVSIAASALSLACCGGSGGGGGNVHGLVTLTTTSVAPGTTGVAYTQTFAADFPHPPGKFMLAAGALPPGLHIDQDSGLLSGYPRQVGTFNFTIAARDGSDPDLPAQRDVNFAEDRRAFTMVVDRGPPNILPQTLPTAQYRASYGYQIDIAGGTPPYFFAQTGGELPNGISVGNTGFVGNFPTQARQAPYEFQVTVTDANNLQDTDTLSLTVVILPLIIGTSSPLPQAAKDFPYDITLELASIGGGAPYAWSALPPGPGETALSSIGMEVSANGHVRNSSAFPGPSATGTYLFTVQVTDEPGQVATRQYSIKINPGPVLQAITPYKAAVSGPYTAKGLNFQPGAKLAFRPGTAEVVVTPVYVNATTLTFNPAPAAPAGAGGFVDVEVRNPDGGFFNLGSAFAFPATNLTFNATPVYPTPQSSLSSTGLAVGDVNKDGWADIVHCGSGSSAGSWYNTTGSTGGVDLLLNAAVAPFSGQFTRLQMDTGSEWHQVKLADVDSDGDLDIVAVGRVGGQPRARVWLNPYPSPFTTSIIPKDTTLPYASPYISGNHLSDMVIGQLDGGNTVPDLVYTTVDNYSTTSSAWINRGGTVVSVRGNGNGTFTSTAIDLRDTISDFASAGGVAVGNFNSDNVDDVVIGDQYSSYASFNWGTGIPGQSGQVAMTVSATGLFGTFNPLAASGAQGQRESMGVAVGDVNGDAATDLLFAAGSYSWSGAAGVTAFSGNGSGSFSTMSVQTASGGLYRYVTVFDADFDVPFDVAATVDNGRIDIWKGRTGTSGLQFKQTISISGPNYGRIAAGDFNKDGRDDLCAALSFLADVYSGHQTQQSRGLGSTQGVVIFLNTSN